MASVVAARLQQVRGRRSGDFGRDENRCRATILLHKPQNRLQNLRLDGFGSIAEGADFVCVCVCVCVCVSVMCDVCVMCA